MAPDFDRFARMPWPIDCWASSGIKLLSSAFAFSCVGTATIHRIEKSSAGSRFPRFRAFKRRLKTLALFLSTTTEARASGFG